MQRNLIFLLQQIAPSLQSEGNLCNTIFSVFAGDGDRGAGGRGLLSVRHNPQRDPSGNVRTGTRTQALSLELTTVPIFVHTKTAASESESKNCRSKKCHNRKQICCRRQLKHCKCHIKLILLFTCINRLKQSYTQKKVSMPPHFLKVQCIRKYNQKF